MADTDAGGAGPDPAARAKGRADGVPVTLADGRHWNLAHAGTAPTLDAPRDDIFDGIALYQKVDVTAAIRVAYTLLHRNYALAEDEALALLAGADRKGLVAAVIEALFGADAPRRTWSTWARSALVANAIEPAKVDPELLPHVLRQLVQTGRAIPLGEYSEAMEAAEERSQWLALAKPQADG